MPQPQFPLYIPSKGRWDSRFTSRELERLKVPYYVVIEEQEFPQYSSVIDKKKILVLDKSYQKNYETFDDFGDTKVYGGGPSRNFAWDHAISNGFDWHWVMDDNIRYFYRLNNNKKIYFGDGTGFRVMEDFVLRYENVGMAGPQYSMFAPRKQKWPPFIKNTRIYSCNFIRNDLPFRWRGRMNEDTDLSLNILKDGWCTIQFNAFLQNKVVTQQVKGGNTEQYLKDGTLFKSQWLVDRHPDVTRIIWRFGRIHHYIDYKKHFGNLQLKRKKDIDIPTEPNEYGMKLVKIDPKDRVNGRT